MQQPGSNPSPPAALPIPRTILLGSYFLLAGLLVYALVTRWFLPLYAAQPIGIERSGELQPPGLTGGAATASTPAMFDDRIDPNTAGWAELTRLPGIGEVTAKRIVAYRQAHASESSGPVFSRAEDMGKVRGIGPKTIEAVKPLLKFEP